MRIRTFRSVLDECLAALQRGESIEACLARYPRHAERLRPLLTLAQRVGRTPPQLPRAWARETAWELIRSRAADLRRGGRRRGAGIDYGAWLRPLAIATALLVAVIGGTGATALAAQDALPDSPLYRVKLWTEDARLWLVFDDSHEAEILLDQSNERVAEITALVQKNKGIPANVLSALYDRNQRAANILADEPQEAALRARLRDQSAAQEDLLLALWENVAASARDEYVRAVALIHNTRLQGGGAIVSITPQDLAGGIRHIEGAVSPVAEGIWNVGGLDVRIDDRTIGRAALQQGATARLIVAVGAGGELQALSLSTIAVDAPPTRALVSGEIQQVTDNGIWLSGGQFIPFSSQTIQTGKLKVGERVEVTLETTQAGTVASSVKAAAAEAPGESDSLTFEGTIADEVSSKSSQWNVGGLTFETSGATVDARAGKAAKGARVLVEATIDNGKLVASSITVLASEREAPALHIVGRVQGAPAGTWMVGGLRISPPAGAGAPPEGSLVAVEAVREGQELRAARSMVIELPGQSGVTRVLAAVRSIRDAAWDVDTGQVRITSTTIVSGDPVPGGRALIWGRPSPSGDLEAIYVRILDTAPVTATATPGPSPTPAPTPTPRP